MTYLLSAIISSTMISICMRISERYIRSTMTMFTANYAVCFLISRFYLGDARLFASRSGMTTAVGLGVISGVLYLASFGLFRRSIQYNGVVLSSASMKLGAVLIPVMAAVLLFHEQIKWLQIWGSFLAVLAILLINIEKEEVHHSGKKVWLVILLASSGITETMTNVYHQTGPQELGNHYLSFTFLTALFLALSMALYKKEHPRPADVLYGLLIGIPNYYASRFVLLALGEVPAVIVYPVCSVGSIITITLVGVAVFREKLSRQKMAALGLILAALVMLNIP